jgi:hypothetical protein
MDICEGLNTSLDCFLETIGRVGLRETHHRLHIRQQIFSSVFCLPIENRNLRFDPLPVSNVAGNLRSAEDSPFGAHDRRDGQRNIDQPSVLALANGLIMLNALAAPDKLQNYVILILTLRRCQDGHPLADGVLGQIAKEPLRTLVPACDNAMEIFAYYCIIAVLDGGGKLHPLKEGVDVNLLNHFLQSPRVIWSFAGSHPFVKPSPPVRIGRSETVRRRVKS